MPREIRVQVILGEDEKAEIDTERAIEDRPRSEFMRRAALNDARQKRKAREGKA